MELTRDCGVVSLKFMLSTLETQGGFLCCSLEESSFFPKKSVFVLKTFN